MKHKKLIIAVGIFVTIFLLITYKVIAQDKKAILFSYDTNSDNQTDYEISFEGPGSLTWDKQPEIVKDYKFATEKINSYKLKENGQTSGTLTLTTRQVEDKDVIYFLKYEHSQPIPGLRATITALNETSLKGRNSKTSIQGRQLLYGKEINNRDTNWGNFELYKLNGDDLPTNTVFLDSPTHHLRLGLIDVFKPLKNKVREESFQKSTPIKVLRRETDIDYIIDFPQETGYFVETWGILSNSQLIDWDNEKASDDARVGDLVRYRKLSTDGIYYLTPWNYYPTEKTAFWLNPASTYHVAGLFSRQDGGNYFKDISISSMYSVIQTQTKDYYWVTSPRSDWLYQEYGISEGFFDTRFNTDVGLYLVNMYEKTGEKEALKAAKNYATWLKNYVEQQGITTAGGGKLVPDYFKPGLAHKKTNVSLNHLVAEMNFLYKLYKVDNDFSNFKTANLIKQAVRDTGRNWIRPDGDLHYAYLGEGKFGMQDYPLITLNDLRVAQKLIQTATGTDQGDEVIQMLIDAKETYLTKKGLPLH